jgi:hypothetical protein
MRSSKSGKLTLFRLVDGQQVHAYYYYYYYRFSTIKPISLGQQPKYLTILQLLCPSLIGEGEREIVDFRLSRVPHPCSALESATEGTFLQTERSPLSFTAGSRIFL